MASTRPAQPGATCHQAPPSNPPLLFPWLSQYTKTTPVFHFKVPTDVLLDLDAPDPAVRQHAADVQYIVNKANELLTGATPTNTPTNGKLTLTSLQAQLTEQSKVVQQMRGQMLQVMTELDKQRALHRQLLTTVEQQAATAQSVAALQMDALRAELYERLDDIERQPPAAPKKRSALGVALAELDSDNDELEVRRAYAVRPTVAAKQPSESILSTLQRSNRASVATSAAITTHHSSPGDQPLNDDNSDAQAAAALRPTVAAKQPRASLLRPHAVADFPATNARIESAAPNSIDDLVDDASTTHRAATPTFSRMSASHRQHDTSSAGRIAGNARTPPLVSRVESLPRSDPSWLTQQQQSSTQHVSRPAARTSHTYASTHKTKQTADSSTKVRSPAGSSSSRAAHGARRYSNSDEDDNGDVVNPFAVANEPINSKRMTPKHTPVTATHAATQAHPTALTSVTAHSQTTLYGNRIFASQQTAEFDFDPYGSETNGSGSDVRSKRRKANGNSIQHSPAASGSSPMQASVQNAHNCHNDDIVDPINASINNIEASLVVDHTTASKQSSQAHSNKTASSTKKTAAKSVQKKVPAKRKLTLNDSDVETVAEDGLAFAPLDVAEQPGDQQGASKTTQSKRKHKSPRATPASTKSTAIPPSNAPRVTHSGRQSRRPVSFLELQSKEVCKQQRAHMIDQQSQDFDDFLNSIN